jgi:dienelactone hydrolase
MASAPLRKGENIMHRIMLALLGPLVILPVALPQETGKNQPTEDLTVLTGGAKETPPHKLLYEYLRGEAQKCFEARRKVVAALKTADDGHRRQRELRARFIDAIGGFPEKTPLNADVIGKEQRDGYRVERIIYESRPLHHVTANLYVPDGRGPFPAVLMPMGHSDNGKANGESQRACILLAKNGLAALAYDPISQGERRQLLDANGKRLIGNMTTEHTLIGVGALLVGRNTASYRIWDGIRSLDYLCSRPDIDAKRLGCTGCSGGGTLTAYRMALDERIFAAAPSCYITSLERLFATIGPQDGEQNITGQVAFGMEHADYLLLHAPRPTLLLVASRDFFDNQGTWTAYHEASLVYGVLGHPERVHLAEFDTGHGYPKPQREAMVQWMRRWLLEKDDAPPAEPDVVIAKDEKLQCTRTGQVLLDFKGKSAFHLNVDCEKELAGPRAKLLEVTGTEDLLKDVRRLIAVPDKVAAAQVREIGTVKRDGYVIHKRLFQPERGIPVPALDFVPVDGTSVKAVVLYLHGAGKAADAARGGVIEKLVQSGKRVLALDLRGLGETAPGPAGKGKNLLGADVKEAFLGLHLNRPLLGQRVEDVLSVVEWLANDPAIKHLPIDAIGIGAAGPVALHAAALDVRIVELTLEQSIVSWSAVVRTPLSVGQLSNVVPDALATYDLPDLARRLTPRRLTVRDAVDPTGQPVQQGG